MHNYAGERITMQAYAATKKLLLGNLPDSARQKAVEELFAGLGAVLSVALLSHGFAFVEMASDDADLALTRLKGCRLGGNAVTIDEAHPKGRARYA